MLQQSSPTIKYPLLCYATTKFNYFSGISIDNKINNKMLSRPTPYQSQATVAVPVARCPLKDDHSTLTPYSSCCGGPGLICLTASFLLSRGLRCPERLVAWCQTRWARNCCRPRTHGSQRLLLTGFQAGRDDNARTPRKVWLVAPVPRMIGFYARSRRSPGLRYANTENSHPVDFATIPPLTRVLASSGHITLTTESGLDSWCSIARQPSRALSYWTSATYTSIRPCPERFDVAILLLKSRSWQFVSDS